MSNFRNIIAQKFGKLTVKELHHAKTFKCGQKVEFYLCQCDCGNETIVSKKNLTTLHVKSCGCLKHIAYNYSHKLTNTRIHDIWTGIKNRCFDEASRSYKNYGKRGITVCNEWLTFENFYNWAKQNGYNDTLTIDRIDVNGNYEPSNCRWTTYKVQARNTRKNKYITYKGETHCISEWAEIYNINYIKLYKRLKRGWSFEKSIEV